MGEVVLLDSAEPLAPFRQTLTLLTQGKVREMWGLPGERILMVATDRISVFDVVLPNGIPGKGAVLTQMSAFWFQRTKDVALNHFIRLADGSPADELPFQLPPELVGRTMIVRKVRRLDVECVARGYLSGSGWKDYRQTGGVCGVALPPGLRESDQLPMPIFTPATKAPDGEHDINISFEEMAGIVGADTAERLRGRTLALYCSAADYARSRGIIVADTKFEFGWVGDELIVIDEMLTPDSSRFWPADQYEPGGPQPSFDKQPVRDYTEGLGWDKKQPGPELPPEVVSQTTARYRDGFRLLIGRDIAV